MSTDTADRILDRAQELMAERGYNGFSYADIAAVVKVSKPSIHFHYATKAVLAQKVLQRYRGAAMAGLQQLSSQVPGAVARLEAYAGYWQKCIHENVAPFCVCAMLASEMPTLPGEVKSEVQTHFRDLEAWLVVTLDAGAGRGELHLPRGAVLEAQSFLSLLHGAMLAARVFGDAAAFGAVMGDAIGRLRSAD